MLDAYRCLMECAKQYAFDYMEHIDAMPATPGPEAKHALDCFDEPLPRRGTMARDVLSLLHTRAAPATTAQTGGRYFGFVIGGLLPVAHAASWLADTWNQNTGLAAMSPAASRLEAVCERWLAELLHLPAGTAMGLVTGSANALICTLAAARNTLLERQGWDVARLGLRRAPALRVIAGEDAHATVLSGLSLLGIGADEIETVPTDEDGRMRLDALPEMDRRTLCILQAGNVCGGACDPIEAVCAKARAAGAWVHVDGAFALWAGASRRFRHLVAGMEQADSWSLDAHKTLNAGYDCGIALCRHREALISALQARGAYIPYGDERDNMSYTTEMSRRARAVPLWAVLKCLGAEGVERLVDTLCDHAAFFAALLREAGMELVRPVSFNQCMVACGSEERTAAVLKAVQESGVCWCGSARWKGRLVIRVSVCSHATTRDDIEKSAAVFARAVHKSARQAGA